MSSRLPTSPSRRSASASIVARKSCRSASGQSISSSSSDVTDALIPARGVRRSCDTAERIASLRSLTRSRSSASEASASSSSMWMEPASSVTNASSSRRSSSGTAGPTSASAWPASTRSGVLATLGVRADLLVHHPVAVGSVPQGDAVEGEGPADRLEDLDDARGSRQPREGLRLRTRALSLVRATRGEGDEPAHGHRDDEEDREREEVLALADRERVEGRREVPVRQEEARDRGRERRPDAADGRDDDDDEEVEEQHAGQPEVAPERGQDHRERGEGRCRESAPATTRCPGRLVGRRCPGLSGAPPAWLMTWTSTSSPESRITRRITDPRRSSVSRERRVAPSTICVAFMRRAVSTSALPTSSPTTSRYVPPRRSTSVRWPREGIGGLGRQAVL